MTKSEFAAAVKKKLIGLQKRAPIAFVFEVSENTGEVFVSVKNGMERGYLMDYESDPKAFIRDVYLDLEKHFPTLLNEKGDIFTITKINLEKNQILVKDKDGAISIYYMKLPVFFFLKWYCKDDSQFTPSDRWRKMKEYIGKLDKGTDIYEI